ncbi:unnamed protein product [Pieris macdunnoughi]|uniref:Uncharacterized protein n=1 Tax=Pieris macdunnoughi TaxID=345717 RepID=A0A821VL95_9NEOP|nr:unnamed protein product [Pieris macdunnoughi]
MLSFKSIVLIAAAFASTIEASGVVGVAPVAAPLVAPAHIGYAHAVPDNVPPYASQVNIESRAVNVPYAAPYVAPSFYSSPYVSPYSFPAPLASYSSYPYGAAPLVRSAYGLAPAFVR